MSKFANIPFVFRFNAVTADKQVEGFKYEVVDEEDPTKVKRVSETHSVEVPSLAYFGIEAGEISDGKYQDKEANLLFEVIKQTVKDFIKPLVEAGKEIPTGNIWDIIANTAPAKRGRAAGSAAVHIGREMKAMFCELFAERRRALGKPEAGIVQQTTFLKALAKDANTRTKDWLKVVLANIDDLVENLGADDLEAIAPMVEVLQKEMQAAIDAQEISLEDAL